MSQKQKSFSRFSFSTCYFNSSSIPMQANVFFSPFLEFLTILTVSHSIKEIYSFCSRKTLAVNPSATDRLCLCIHDFDDAYRHSCRAKIRNAKQVYLNVLLITKTERVLNCIYSSSHCSTCWLCMLFTTDYSFSKIFTFSKLFYFHSRATPHL